MLAAAREVLTNYDRLIANGQRLQNSRFMHYVRSNGPNGLYAGYIRSLYALVRTAMTQWHGSASCSWKLLACSLRLRACARTPHRWSARST